MKTKFRAWHKTEKKMCEVSLINFDKGAFLIGVKKGEDEYIEGGKKIVIAPEDGRFCEWNEFELLQFTGLKDKNGVEIYEFDIVAIDNEENPVITKCIYEPGYFTLLDSAGGSWTRQLFHQQERLEVVGNRFENPELL